MPDFENEQEKASKQEGPEHYSPSDKSTNKESRSHSSNLRGRWKPSSRGVQLSPEAASEALKPVEPSKPAKQENQKNEEEPKSERQDRPRRESNRPQRPRQESRPERQGDRPNYNSRQREQRYERPERTSSESTSSSRESSSSRTPKKPESILRKILRFLGLAPKKKSEYPRRGHSQRGYRRHRQYSSSSRKSNDRGRSKPSSDRQSSGDNEPRS